MLFTRGTQSQMAKDSSTWRTVVTGKRARALQSRWQKLCTVYLPLPDDESMWNYHRESDNRGPDCGWKLHISATILNAPAILRRVAPFLAARNVQFKAPRLLTDVLTLNSGLLHTYSQVGKVFTVYPRTDDEAVNLAVGLHELTRRFKAPSVPFDLRFAETSNVYYRYGAFKKIEIEHAGRGRTLGMMNPEGKLIPDVRENPKPDWVDDPFVARCPRRRTRKPRTERITSFHVLRALVQRGKGGVYQAIDVQSNPPRMCLLKEGRRHGEVSWDGRDGAWRVRHEERVLSQLLNCGINVPRVYSRFEMDENSYLVMEFVDGESLHDLLVRQSRRLPFARVAALGVEVAAFLAQMHRAGWAWRDCKPKNLIVTSAGTLIPIDFEGASRIAEPDNVLWGTRGFLPLHSHEGAVETGVTEDLFALGSILYLLITGRYHDPEQPASISKLRRNVPQELRRLVDLLLADEPQKRPAAHQVQAELNSILLKYSDRPQSLSLVKAA
jgi:Protein kinase domain